MREEVQAIVRSALGRSFQLGQRFAYQSDSESYSENRKARDTQAIFEEFISVVADSIDKEMTK